MPNMLQLSRLGAEDFYWTPRTGQQLVEGTVSVTFTRRGRAPAEDSVWAPARVTADNRVRLLVGGPLAADRDELVRVPAVGEWDAHLGGSWPALGQGWGTARRRVVKATRAATVRAVIFAVLVAVLGVLATARLTRLLTADRIFLPVRAAIARRFGPSSAIAYLVNCRWCTSIYLAPPIAAAEVWLVPEFRLGWWLPTVLLGALLALAHSHLTALLAGLEDED